MPTHRLRSQSRPCASYSEAAARVEALCAKDTPDINPLCKTVFLAHGQKTKRAIVFWHGYTNCPRQFHQLAGVFFERGYNALIPRLPQHGLADRMTTALERLTIEDLLWLADESLDIACGLGERVTVVGLSAGGAMAAWAAHERADVEQAVLIAPGFAFKLAPASLTRPLTQAASALPNMFIWWDSKTKERIPGPQYAYPRFSTRALAAFNRIAFEVQDAARRSKPAARSILVVINAHDGAVDNNVTLDVVENWRRQGANVEVYEFPAELKLNHDLIDPDQPEGRIEVVYPKLVELIVR